MPAFTTPLVWLALAHAAFAQLPPVSFGLPTTPISLDMYIGNDPVLYGTIHVTPGEYVGIDVVNDAPATGLGPLPENGQRAGSGLDSLELAAAHYYSLIVYDADTRILQYLDHDLQTPAATGAPIYHFFDAPAPPILIPYAQPKMSPSDPPQRFIVYLYQQLAPNFTLPQAYAGLSASNRSNFDVAAFAMQAGWGAPFAATWCYISNQTGLGVNYVAPSDGGYPPLTTSVAATSSTLASPPSSAPLTSTSRASVATATSPCVYQTSPMIHLSSDLPSSIAPTASQSSAGTSNVLSASASKTGNASTASTVVTTASTTKTTASTIAASAPSSSTHSTSAGSVGTTVPSSTMPLAPLASSSAAAISTHTTPSPIYYTPSPTTAMPQLFTGAAMPGKNGGIVSAGAIAAAVILAIGV